MLPPLGGEEDDRFKEGGEILLALLTVCGFENAAKDDKEKNIIRYAVANIAEELMQPYGTAEVVALTGGMLALLASPKEAVNDALARQCLMEISESAASVLGLSISAVYLQTRCENAILSRSYRELLTHTHYTLLYGSRFVLSEEELCTQDARSPVYPTELEAAILEALSAASAEAAAGKLRLFLQAICEDSAQGYFNCVIQLAISC